MLDRIALIVTLMKAVLSGAVMGVVSVLPRGVTMLAWLCAALALASCVILAAT